MDPETLQQVELFAGLSPEELAFFAERMEVTTVPISEHVVRDGDFAYRLYAVVEGTAAVSRDNQVLATIEAGGVFGEMALSDDLPRNAHVVAVTDLRVATLLAWDFREARERFPEFRRRVDELVISRRPPDVAG